MSDSSEDAPAGQDRFRLKAAEYRTLAKQAKDPVIADGYRRLAEGYESLAGRSEATPTPAKSNR